MSKQSDPLFGPGLLPPGPRMFQIGGNCPVQAEGDWGGREIYFRARGDRWTLGVGSDSSAAGLFGISGWMPRPFAAELVRLHLWSWSWLERGIEEDGPQGKLCRSLRRLEPEAARSALAAGADPSAPLEPGGPSPLAMALGLCDLGAPGVDASKAGADDEGAMCAWAVWDEQRSARRGACVEALLEFGARPSDAPEGWGLLPVHWAATLPSGQPSAEAGVINSIFDTDAQVLAAMARVRAAEPRRSAANPLWALLAAGADPGAEGHGEDALDWAMGGESMHLAERLAGTMGGRALRRVAMAFVSRAGTDAMSASLRSPEGEPVCGTFLGAAFQKALLEFSSGSWDLDWLDEEVGRGGLSGSRLEAVRELRLRAGSARELKSLGAAAREPEARTMPALRL